MGKAKSLEGYNVRSALIGKTLAPLISVVILNYNGREYLDRCLSSLQRSDYPLFEIILVDNASSDGSADLVKKNYPMVKLVALKQNLGFAGGNNVGLTHSKGSYVLFLNNDTEVTPDWMKHIIETAVSDTTIGVVGCKVLLMDKPNTIDCIGGFVCDVFGYGLYALGHGEVDRGQYNGQTEIFSVVGSCLLIKKELCQQLGGFDHKYFMMGEDIDICWRARLLGYKIKVNPMAIIYHKSMGTIKKKLSRPLIRFLSERNALRSIIKNYATPTLFQIIPEYLSFQLIEVMFFLLLGNFRLAIADIKAVVWNIKNLRDTWQKHMIIQSTRLVPDKSIRRNMIRHNLKVLRLPSLLKITMKMRAQE